MHAKRQNDNHPLAIAVQFLGLTLLIGMSHSKEFVQRCSNDNQSKRLASYRKTFKKRKGSRRRPGTRARSADQKATGSVVLNNLEPSLP
eukprot:665492-Amphidinium_carterae.2